MEARGVSFAECVRQGEGEAWREGEAKKGVRIKGDTDKRESEADELRETLRERRAGTEDR